MDQSRQRQGKPWKHRESNPGQLGEKLERYLGVLPPLRSFAYTLTVREIVGI